MREKPHEIEGQISKDGKIKYMKCSCKAGLSEKCKHIVCLLLFLSRNSFSTLEAVSCTDKKFLCKNPQSLALDRYNPVPVNEHACFVKESSAELQLKPDLVNVLKSKLKDINENGALSKYSIGRHKKLKTSSNNCTEVCTEEIKNLFLYQDSPLMLSIAEQNIVIEPCCKDILKFHDQDVHDIFIKTKTFRTEWFKQRESRITGSRAHELYTYFKNKVPNWEKKSEKYFVPKQLKKKYVKHGIASEPLEILAFERHHNVKVIKCGLVVSKLNTWIGYSPDGIVFQNKKPHTLIEVKCPFYGKTMRIEDVIEKLKWVERTEEGKIIFKHRQYYTQVQFGMAVLNVKSTNFIIYSLFNDSFVMFNIEYDEQYCKD